ncbi:hypothetical protein [Nonomuraea angiospora]|nr:hypothetical protein [Nonomuraea angiospora]MDX3108416.1 hypothetical protein [Nonomuraea angiospora]
MANDYYGAGDVVVIDIARRERVMRFDAVAGRRLGAAWTVTTGAFDPYEPADPMPALAFTWGIRRSPRLAGGLPGPHQHRY